MDYNLERFIVSQKQNYNIALTEIKNGRKLSHWMWYVFPQLKGLGHSTTAQYYGISGLDEAKAYLNDEYLGKNLLEISNALLAIDCDDARIVMGPPDDLKLKSSMTLFSVANPDEPVFKKVLDKFFNGKPDFKSLRMLGIYNNPFSNGEHKEFVDDKTDKIFKIQDDNIKSVRERYPNGLHFVVGDTHGAYVTLQKLMEKIEFDPQKDHVYFVGDYNAGGVPELLLKYMAKYYQEDYEIAGFHLIRGNHERELWPYYPLPNLPDVIVVKGRVMTYYIAHAGMVNDAFDLINENIKASSDVKTHAYCLNENIAGYDAPFRQIIWSRKGLYSQKSHYHVWPSVESLHNAKACVIHGHTPFAHMKVGNYFSYGDEMLFWENQKIWFAEDLQSFDVDSNIKGAFVDHDLYRGLSCVCLELLDEIAEKGNGVLKRDVIRNSENFVFSMPFVANYIDVEMDDISKILDAKPKMKQIMLNEANTPVIVD